MCVRLSYQDELEQVWITLVQVRLHVGGGGGTKLSCALLQQFSKGPCVQRIKVSVSGPQCSVNAHRGKVVSKDQISPDQSWVYVGSERALRRGVHGLLQGQGPKTEKRATSVPASTL